MLGNARPLSKKCPTLPLPEPSKWHFRGHSPYRARLNYRLQVARNLPLPAAFSQTGDGNLAEPCTTRWAPGPFPFSVRDAARSPLAFPIAREGPSSVGFHWCERARADKSFHYQLNFMSMTDDATRYLSTAPFNAPISSYPTHFIHFSDSLLARRVFLSLP